MCQIPERYGIRAGLAEGVIRAALKVRWAGRHDLEITPLPGGHAEGAVLNVHVADPLEAFSRVPLVAPAIAGRQMFVNHPDVARFLRRQIALWMVQQQDISGLSNDQSGALYQAIESLHLQQLDTTLRALAAGLPIYDVTVQRDGRCEVKAAGHVPKEG